MASVSYTPLDVYKRQARDGARRKGIREGDDEVRARVLGTFGQLPPEVDI